MSRRSHFLDAPDNFENSSLRFVNSHLNEVGDSLHQMFGGADAGSPGPVNAPPRDFKVVQPTPDDPRYIFELEERRDFLKRLGLQRDEVESLTERSFLNTQFNLETFKSKRHELRKSRMAQPKVDALILRDIKLLIDSADDQRSAIRERVKYSNERTHTRMRYKSNSRERIRHSDGRLNGPNRSGDDNQRTAADLSEHGRHIRERSPIRSRNSSEIRRADKREFSNLLEDIRRRDSPTQHNDIRIRDHTLIDRHFNDRSSPIGASNYRNMHRSGSREFERHLIDRSPSPCVNYRTGRHIDDLSPARFQNYNEPYRSRSRERSPIRSEIYETVRRELDLDQSLVRHIDKNMQKISEDREIYSTSRSWSPDMHTDNVYRSKSREIERYFADDGSPVHQFNPPTAPRNINWIDRSNNEDSDFLNEQQVSTIPQRIPNNEQHPTFDNNNFDAEQRLSNDHFDFRSNQEFSSHNNQKAFNSNERFRDDQRFSNDDMVENKQRFPNQMERRDINDDNNRFQMSTEKGNNEYFRTRPQLAYASSDRNHAFMNDIMVRDQDDNNLPNDRRFGVPNEQRFSRICVQKPQCVSNTFTGNDLNINNERHQGIRNFRNVNSFPSARLGIEAERMGQATARVTPQNSSQQQNNKIPSLLDLNPFNINQQSFKNTINERDKGNNILHHKKDEYKGGSTSRIKPQNMNLFSGGIQLPYLELNSSNTNRGNDLSSIHHSHNTPLKTASNHCFKNTINDRDQGYKDGANSEKSNNQPQQCGNPQNPNPPNPFKKEISKTVLNSGGKSSNNCQGFQKTQCAKNPSLSQNDCVSKLPNTQFMSHQQHTGNFGNSKNKYTRRAMKPALLPTPNIPKIQIEDNVPVQNTPVVQTTVVPNTNPNPKNKKVPVIVPFIPKGIGVPNSRLKQRFRHRLRRQTYKLQSKVSSEEIMNCTNNEDPTTSTKMIRQKGKMKVCPELYWPTWWEAYKWIEDELPEVSDEEMKSRFNFNNIISKFKDQNRKRNAEKIYEVGVRKIRRHYDITEENHYLRDGYGIFKHKLKLTDPSLREELNAAQLYDIDKAISYMPEWKWTLIYQAMVTKWSLSQDVAESTRTSSRIKEKHAKKFAKDNLFHWCVRQALEELKKITAKDWPQFEDFYDDL